jgi:PAS domain S-box-containing protein
MPEMLSYGQLLTHLRSTMRLPEGTDAPGSRDEHNRWLIQVLPDGVGLVDLQGVFMAVNAKVVGMLGYGSTEELLGKSLFDLTPPGEHDRVRATLARALQGQEIENGEYRAIRKDKAEIWVEVNAAVLANEHQRPYVVVLVARDITRRKQAEEQLASLLEMNQAILKVSMVGIAAFRASGQCVFANEALAQTLGMNVEQLSATNVFQLDGWQKSGLLKMAQETLQSGEMHASEIHYITAGGREVWLDCRMASFRSQGEEHLLAMVNETTVRRRLEHAILRVGEEEQRRIAADLHDSMCQQLFSMAMACNLLKKGLSANGRPEAEGAAKLLAQINEMIAQAHRLARGLSLSALAQKGLTVALQDLADRTTVEFGTPCVFEMPEGLSVSDPVIATHLYRIAAEAIHNAVKHARANRIRVSLQVSGDTACLGVRDDGIGLSAEAQPGRGLGLLMMRERARLIGGELQISRPRSGGTKVACQFQACFLRAGGPASSR